MALYLGIGIGDTNIELDIIDEEGQIVSSQTLSTKQHGGSFADYVTALGLQINQIVADPALLNKVVGTDIGAPSTNYSSGCIEEAVSLPWAGSSPIVAELSAQTGLPVVLDNDANASTLGEHSYGAVRRLDHFIEITLDTGVGSGIYADGRLMHGCQGEAGELGHIAAGEPYQRCGCGRYGCLEASIAAPAVTRRTVSLKKLCLE